MLFVLFAVLIFQLEESNAQADPVRPVRIVVGFPPGGGVDVNARAAAWAQARRVPRPAVRGRGPETLVARVLRLVRVAVDEVVLVAREGQVLPHRLDAVRDPAEGLGPLAGIAAGLGAVTGERAFVAACDMPLLRPALMRRLLDLSHGVEACVPVVDGFPVPTCTVYATAVAGRAGRLVAARQLRPMALLESVATRFVAGDELRDVDPALESFLDCDTEEAYQAALRAAGLGPKPATSSARATDARRRS